MRSEDRTNTRNGYRNRDWDTRVGTIDLAIPKLRSGSYFPDWLLEHRRRRTCSAISSIRWLMRWMLRGQLFKIMRTFCGLSR